ncbi:MAG TPA: hypothetical protein VMK66_03600 [Myxococcales bacterium]|nr:hypothetical protein [Myxococcales bacterium]
MSVEIETRSVGLKEARAGVQLRTGRRYLLVVDGIRGKGFRIEVQLHAAGGTPLAGERVRILDPETGEAVGEPILTDGSGILSASVPREKEYEIHVLGEQAEDEGHAWAEMDAPTTGPDRHAVLDVQFLDAEGAPAKDLEVQLEDAEGAVQEAVCGADGRIHLVVEPGLFTLEAGGASFVAHSVFHDELDEEDPAYRFALA